ncbi:MAG TPA: hypothetical protein VGG64_05985 [Pirellulales bacterium]|jgi:hypothetical protein
MAALSDNKLATPQLPVFIEMKRHRYIRRSTASRNVPMGVIAHSDISRGRREEFPLPIERMRLSDALNEPVATQRLSVISAPFVERYQCSHGL